MKVLKNYINGKFVDSKSERFIEFMNPALDEPLGKTPMSTREEVESVVKAARDAYFEWRKVPGVQRIQPLFRLLNLIKENIDDIAESIVINHGKEWNAAVGEVIRAYQMIEASFTVPEYQKGQYMPNIATGIDEYSILEPLGVFIMIPPFNFPAMIPFWFWPFAVATGNTYIIKSNEQTPLAFQHIFKYIDEAGFPPGVINFIHGDVEIANQLIEHPDVVGVSSVGSTPVAQAIYKKASSFCKRAQCHGGANNFLVITEKANVEQIMTNLLNSLFGNSGQRCLSGAVVMIVGKQSFYEQFKEKLLNATKALKIGYGMDKQTFMGPVISKKSLNNLHSQIQNGIDEGAKLILDGRGIKVKEYEKGYFLGPCLFENAKPGMTIYDEEVFGPVACLDRVDNLEEAIKIINQNPKGNAVTIYTESGEEARFFRDEIYNIQLGINIGVVAPLAWFPFAGARNSFFGTLRAQGYESVKFFTQERVIIEKFHGSTKIEWD
ncbi:MAG: CoA-acylating methylmalonate-semialdehyde dehydrogenase [Candidatus Lokiarchaeota archaeon]|nr:CoA-acylating methylmalonate-semialdehyde dehydrogenase [Candidatus Lokiarchaeota archaeon]